MTRLAPFFSVALLVLVPGGLAGPACSKRHVEASDCVEKCRSKWGWPGKMMGTDPWGVVMKNTGSTEGLEPVISKACGTKAATPSLIPTQPVANVQTGLVTFSSIATTSSTTSSTTATSSTSSSFESASTSSSTSSSSIIEVSTSSASSTTPTVPAAFAFTPSPSFSFVPPVTPSPIEPIPTTSAPPPPPPPKKTSNPPPPPPVTTPPPPPPATNPPPPPPATTPPPPPPPPPPPSTSSSRTRSSSTSRGPAPTKAPEPNKFQTPSTGGGSSSTEDGDIQAYLSSHNSVRANHGAVPLTWSDDLASKAQQWANGCLFQHSGGIFGRIGENLAAGTGDYTIQTAVKAWTDEVSEYNPSNPKSSHFTQVVWKATTQVGCAVQICDGIFDASFGKARYYVCEYSAAGNVQGQFAQNVQV